MKVILLKDVAGTGRKYDIKDVADGYAQNFLLPRKLAVIASAQAVKNIEKDKEALDKEREIQENLLEKNFEALSNVKVVIQAKASEAGHLFAGIHKKDILAGLKEQHHIEIPEDYVDLHENIKAVGNYKIPVKFKNKKGEFEVDVESN